MSYRRHTANMMMTHASCATTVNMTITATSQTFVSFFQVYWGIILYPCYLCDKQPYCTSWEEATEYHPADVENWSCEYWFAGRIAAVTTHFGE